MDRANPQAIKGNVHAVYGSLRLGNLDRLADDLALLVRCEERDIRCVAATPDTDDAFNRRQPRGVDEPPTVFKVNFEDRMKVRRV